MFREWKLIYEVYEEQNSREIRCLYVMHCNFSFFKNDQIKIKLMMVMIMMMTMMMMMMMTIIPEVPNGEEW